MWARRFLSGPLLAKVKETTGLVGLPVVPEAREKLIELYQRTLLAVQVIPEKAVYRKTVERFTRFRMKVCEEEEGIEQIEERIGNGQVEQLIQQAENELKLIPKMAEWKPWEVPEGHTIKIIDDGVDPPKHLPSHKSSWDDIQEMMAEEEEKEKKEKEEKEKEEQKVKEQQQQQQQQQKAQ